MILDDFWCDLVFFFKFFGGSWLFLYVLDIVFLVGLGYFFEVLGGSWLFSYFFLDIYKKKWGGSTLETLWGYFFSHGQRR